MPPLCFYCSELAESQCPACQKWTCYEDRRDFPPDFDEHWCIDCTGMYNDIMIRYVLPLFSLHRFS